jgi:S-adenosylmethionine-diacylgycerolhomoserine-N-methlytransferase
MATTAPDVAAAMDRMYRRQRHVYDLTRKYFLFGRDRMLDALAPSPGARVCEIGCGTARNLIRLARRHPAVALYGIDASAEMLKTADAAIARAGLDARIRTRRGLAETLDPRASFGLDRPFDGVICCYALSMMPAWQSALTQALAALKPGGRLDIVDFWLDQALPAWLRGALGAWLARFDVTPRPELAETLRRLAAGHGGHLTVARVLGGYAFHITYWK